MKYCIACAHLDFFKADPGYDTECTAGIGATEAEFACGKGHWRRDISGDYDLPNIEQAMQKAETCPDFSERTSGEP
jgi:hypothetical protein